MCNSFGNPKRLLIPCILQRQTSARLQMQPSQCHGFVCGLQTVSAHRHWSDGACSFPQENPAVTTESTPYASAPDSGRVGASLLSSRPFTPYQLSTRVFAVIIALSVTALSISGYLAWSAFTASDVAGCGGGTISFRTRGRHKASLLRRAPALHL